jgi:sRNA-binding carbon storage regulator CsrA
MQCFLNENDSLTVGSVLISVLEIMHDSVKLGITDPKASPNYREEVLYISSENDDHENDDSDESYELDAVYESLAFESNIPFAIPVL